MGRTKAESRYAEIENELLAVVHGLEHFHQYTYGRHVTIQSTHKPSQEGGERRCMRRQNGYNASYYDCGDMTLI